MPTVNIPEIFYSFDARKRYGKPHSFGQIVIGWGFFGDDDERMGVYHIRRELPNFHAHTKPTLGAQVTNRMRYYYPSNPRTIPQQANRSKFADAVNAWQSLTDEQRMLYRSSVRVERMSAYNHFIKNWLNSH